MEWYYKLLVDCRISCTEENYPACDARYLSVKEWEEAYQRQFAPLCSLHKDHQRDIMVGFHEFKDLAEGELELESNYELITVGDT